MTPRFQAVRNGILTALYGRRGLPRVVNGREYRVDPRSRRMFTAEYDPHVAEYLRTSLERGSEVWNVGANVGVYVLQLMAWLDGSGKIVAFEPNPNASGLLRTNIRLSGSPTPVEIVEAAVGERAGVTDFFIAAADGMSRAGQPNPELAETESIQVSMTTLDDQARTRGSWPDWVVMDIEGWEIGALRGGREVLRRARGVVVEMHPSAWVWSGHSRADLEALFAEEGLRAEPLEGQRDPLGEQGGVLLRRADAPRTDAMPEETGSVA